MRFLYFAHLWRAGPGEIVVSFRDLPECLTGGEDEEEALFEAQDALEEAIAGRIDDAESIPVPSPALPGEYPVTVPTNMAAKAAFALAFRRSGLSHGAVAQRLGTDEESVRRMLDPRHDTPASRLNEALRVLGSELVVEVRELTPA